MPVTREQIIGALQIVLDDEIVEDSDVTREEMEIIKKQFDRVYGQLELEASSDEDDDDDDDDGNGGELEADDLET